jgi:hypothetical protein
MLLRDFSSEGRSEKVSFEGARVIKMAGLSSNERFSGGLLLNPGQWRSSSLQLQAFQASCADLSCWTV